MEHRTFGNSPLKSSVLGFGGWPMGRGMYGSFEENEMIAAVHAAIDAGITLFDTAAIYGWGYGEELMGRALKGKRDKVVLVTKGGLHWNPTMWRSDRDSTKAYLRDCLEDSLRRLQTDYIDLYLIHWPDEKTPFNEPMEAFAQFKKEGKIRFGGVSNFSPAQMQECLKHFSIVTNQVGYNLFDRRIEEEIVPFCKQNGLGIMAYGSLAFGLLTGTMMPDTRFAEDDWRRNGIAFGLPLFQGEHFQRNLRIVDKLKAFAGERGYSVAQLAAAWVISNPVVTVALTGARKPSEILENIKAAQWKLTSEDKKEIEKIFAGEPPMPTESPGPVLGQRR